MVVSRGKISVQNIQFECILGTLPAERENVQPVIVSLVCELDFQPAAQSEHLEATVDYVRLTSTVEQFIQESKFQLIETLVWKVAEKILRENPRILAVEVEVQKPKAIPHAEAKASISMSR